MYFKSHLLEIRIDYRDRGRVETFVDSVWSESCSEEQCSMEAGN